MLSVQVVFFKGKKLKDGTFPVMVQVIKKEATGEYKQKRKTLTSVTKSQWRGKRGAWIKNHESETELNNMIGSIYFPLEQLIITNPDIDINTIFSAEARTGLNFWQISDIYIQSLASPYSRISAGSVINKFKEAVKNDSLLLKDIGKKEIDAFIELMKDRENKESTVRASLNMIMIVGRYAVKNKHSVRNEYLTTLKLPKGEMSPKNKLTEAEFKIIESIALSDPKMIEARDMFVLSYYLRGMRIGDMIRLRQSDFQNGRLSYKTSKNAKFFDIKLVPAAQKIVDKYIDGREKLFLSYKWKPDPKASRDENERSEAIYVKRITYRIRYHLINIGKLAGINKKMSPHIARHTFARIAIGKIKDSTVTRELLGHSTLKVHEAYLREVSNADAMDDAADDIFNL